MHSAFKFTVLGSQIREQMSGNDHHVLTLKSLALKTMFFFHFFGVIFCLIFYKKGFMQIFNADNTVFSKRFLKFLTPNIK